MNNQTPNESPESPLTQKSQGRGRVKLYIFFVLALHFVGLMGLLMLGCQKEKEPAIKEAEAAKAPAFDAYTNSSAMDTNTYASSPIDTNPPPAAPVIDTNPPVAAPTPALATPTVAPTGSEYVIVKGDTFASIAKKQGVSVRALKEANPNVNPAKLKINQKIQLPAPKAGALAADTIKPTASSTHASEPVVSAPNGSASSYTVKSGDTLTRIASHFGVSVKSVKEANSLKTEKIKVGQKLKIPAKKAAKTPPSASVPTPVVTPAPEAGTPAPANP